MAGDDEVVWGLEIDRCSDRTVLRVVGDLDLETAPRLLSGSDPLIDAPGPRLVIDLSRLRFIDSSGLSALIRINQRAAAVGRELSIVPPPAPVAKAFEITGLDRVLPLLPGA